MRDLLRLVRLYRPYRGWMALSILLSLAATSANIGLLALSGWFITAMAAAGLAHVDMNYFTPAALIRLFAILRTGGRYAERLVSHETALRLLAETRTWLFARLVPLAPAAIEDLHSGDILTRLKTDIDRLELVFLRLVAPVVGAVVTLALVGFSLALLDPWLGVAVVAVLLAFGALLPAAAAVRAARESARAAQAAARLRRLLVDTRQGLAPLIAAGAQTWRRPTIDAAFRDVLAVDRKMARVSALGQIGTGLAADLAIIAAAALAIPLVRASAVSGPQLVMAALLALATIEAFGGLPNAFAGLPATLASARRIFAIADRSATVVDPASPVPASDHFDIRFDQVSLAYRKDGPLALADVTLDIPQGAHIAIVGQSGSGKSSLIELLTRFRDPSAGAVRIGGLSLRELSGDGVREKLAIAPQRPHLFSVSIADNLRIARPDASDAQLQEAARRAGLAPLLARLPEGLATPVGVAGAALSGGEAKRVAIARALLADAPILALDEPGEGLDPETEKALIDGILDASAGRTVLLLTHSRAGLDRMDLIVRLEAGRIAPRD